MTKTKKFKFEGLKDEMNVIRITKVLVYKGYDQIQCFSRGEEDMIDYVVVATKTREVPDA